MNPLHVGPGAALPPHPYGPGTAQAMRVGHVVVVPAGSADTNVDDDNRQVRRPAPSTRGTRVRLPWLCRVTLAMGRT